MESTHLGICARDMGELSTSQNLSEVLFVFFIRTEAQKRVKRMRQELPSWPERMRQELPSWPESLPTRSTPGGAAAALGREHLRDLDLLEEHGRVAGTVAQYLLQGLHGQLGALKLARVQSRFDDASTRVVIVSCLRSLF
jgi:hypothetical protein